MRFLIVRLGAFGDLVHALPVAAALRERFPDSRIDWLVDGRYEALLHLVPAIDAALVVNARVGPGARGPSTGQGPSERGEPTVTRFAGYRGMPAAIGVLRRTRYDVAFDLQGLIKSAVLARLSGARRVIGFASGHLREAPAGLFYGERITPAAGRHVVYKNMSVLASVGIAAAPLRFPFSDTAGAVVGAIRRDLQVGPTGAFAALVPGAGWPNKRWPADRFGAVARALADRWSLPSTVLWGPGEGDRADEVAARSGGAARRAPATTLSDLIEIGRSARLVVAGDSGPLHLAAAAGAPVVALLGPTDPARNGPWHPDDESVSRYHECECHYRRRCVRQVPCIDDITVEEVVAAIERRLSRR